MGHAVRFRNDDVQEIVLHIPGNVISGIPDGFGVAADVGQGGPQLVRHVGHEFLAPFLIPVLFRHVMEQDQNAALGLVGEGREVEGQGPVSHHQLIFNVVGFLEGQHVLEGMQVAQQFLVGAAGIDGSPQKLRGGGVAVDEVPLPVKGHHAVGHVEEQGIQLVALVFHGSQCGLQDLGHLVKRSGENTNLVGGFHRQLAVKITGGHPLCADGQLFNGAHHGLGEQEAQQHGNQQADDEGLHDDLEKLVIQIGYRVLVIQNVDDEGVVTAEDGDGHIHVVGGDIAFIAYGGGVLPCNRVPGGQKVGGLLPGQVGGLGAAGQKAACGAVQHIVVPGAVVDAQHTGIDLHDLLNTLGAVRLSGGAAEIRHKLPAVRAEGTAHLLIKAVDIETGDAGGQERAYHRHQGCDQQQEDQRQLHM